MAGILTWLISLGLSPRFAKGFLIAVGVGLALILLGLGKLAYDRSVIRNHTNAQEAATAKADRAADASAADQRRLDDARAHTERQEINDAIEEAEPTPDARRAAYYACLARLQDARRRNLPPAAC